MNFTETVDALAKKGGYTKKAAEEMIRHYEEVVFEGLKSGDGTLRFGNSGTFKIIKRAARKGQNPRTKQPLDIPAKNAIVFKAGKVWSEGVN
jgi:DNA-binding protein HU-beta